MGKSPDRRVAALLAAGLLAGSGAAAASAGASEWDSQDEGPAPPAEPTAGDEVGGQDEETPLPVVVQPLPDEPPPTAPAPEVAPLTVDGPDSPVPEAQEAPPVEPLAVQPLSAPVPALPGPGDVQALDGPLLVEDLRRRSSVPALVLEGVHAQAGRALPRQVQRQAAVKVLEQVATAVRPGQRAYVVRRGDSLWSIAAARLGARATSADVAREVSRLWGLNRARIGTGDPDVLPVGVRLRLR
jgi:nucleoid-associated protein YgaU